MSVDTFAQCLAFTLLPNNDGQPLHITSNDPGGWTNQGVTYATYTAWCRTVGASASMDEFKALTDITVRPIYGSLFWNPLHCDSLPPGVDLMCFDFGVNAGGGRSAKVLQQVLGVNADGWIGTETLKSVAARPPVALITSLMSAQSTFYHGLANFVHFGNGWMARTMRRRSAAVAMVGGYYAPDEPVAAPPPVRPYVMPTVTYDADNSADDLNATELLNEREQARQRGDGE